MKNITTSIRVPLYLHQWLLTRFGSPVRFPPRSAENALLRTLLSRPPTVREMDETKGELIHIVLPDCRLRKPEHYHYLSRRARSTFISHLDDLFRLQLWRDMTPALLGQVGLCKALECWCRTNGISVDGFDAVCKKFYRMRREYAQCGIVLSKSHASA